MINFCICVNCSFYSTCWINYALINFPNNHKNLLNTKSQDQKYFSNIATILKIQLNINLQSYKREPDIIFCDAFIEGPGSWLKE